MPGAEPTATEAAWPSWFEGPTTKLSKLYFGLRSVGFSVAGGLEGSGLDARPRGRGAGTAGRAAGTFSCSCSSTSKRSRLGASVGAASSKASSKRSE